MNLNLLQESWSETAKLQDIFLHAILTYFFKYFHNVYIFATTYLHSVGMTIVDVDMVVAVAA